MRSKFQLVSISFIAMAFATLGYSQNKNTSGSSISNNDTAVLAHLNATINWYKNVATKVPAGTEPSDAIYLNNAKNLGAQVVHLAFQSAKAQVDIESQLNGADPNAPAVPTSSDAQKFAQIESDVSKRIADDQSQIAALKHSNNKASASDRKIQQQSLEGKLELDQASLNAVQQMKAFVENSSSGDSGLKGSINELARSVPEIMETPAVNQAPAAKSQVASTQTATTSTNTTLRSGLLGQLMALYDQMQSIHSIQQRTDEGENIRKIATNLRVPLRAELSSTLQQEKDLAAKVGVTRDQYDALTARFKALSAALVPLSEEIVVLDQSKSNLTQWSKAHSTESRTTLIAILSRVAIILVSVGAIFGLAEVWRRLTFRYIHEPRRRRQFMALRRFVMGFLIFLVIVMGFATEFSSLATFAGLLTAGIAVGLQTILLSVAAYFFVIGRYGISVGDRISVAGVTGDVIDVGLVRFYLMEFAPTGADLYPTGRIVVFSNAVLFQATTPLFKQLPGTRYTWHEAVLPLAAKADYDAVQKALTAAVDPVFKEYDLETLWHRRAFDPIDLSVEPPAPEHRVQFSDNGPELIARYPVDLNRAGEIDDKITRALIEAIGHDENLARSVSGSPKIRPAVKV
jgi:small-conductance mechanosensitive channel